MKRPSALFTLLSFQGAALAFLLFTAGALPATVASHFRAGGSADGFMPRAGYLSLMAALIVVLPLLLAWLQGLLRAIPPRLINLPSRDYWLAPERREASLDFISDHGIYFGALLAAFLGFVHGLVVLANRQQPAHFPESLFVLGLSLFLLAVAIWIGAFFAHFRRRL